MMDAHQPTTIGALTMTNRTRVIDQTPADGCEYCHGGCTICTPGYTAMQYRMVLRGLRAMERHAATAPYGGEVPALPRDAWWASMLASADRVVNAPDATGDQRADARRLARDLTDYADAPDPTV
jgi:hypothetical protein